MTIEENMRTAPIQGSDITSMKPHNGIIHLPFIRSPRQLVHIYWEVDNASGTTLCEAWAAQHEIDCLARAGYKIVEVSI